METKKFTKFTNQVNTNSCKRYNLKNGTTRSYDETLVDDAVIIHILPKVGKNIFSVWNGIFDLIRYNISDMIIMTDSVLGQTVLVTGSSANLSNVDIRNLKTNLEYLKNNNLIRDFKLVV